MPYVFEEVGGRQEDWDTKLFAQLNSKAIIGVICQVKGGDTGPRAKLFQRKHLEYSFRRLGFSSNMDLCKELENSEVINFSNENGQLFQIAKILVSRDAVNPNNKFYRLSTDEVYDFITERIRRYPIEKYRDRYFFSCIGLQTMIETEDRNKRRS
jgi:hypothetical protein